MRIQTNVESLNAYRNLNNTNRSMSQSMERLSSGFRINRASDDAAGLAISEKMRGQVRGLDQATRNAQDANSMIQTAEGALNETHEILQRMRELSVQSANDTNTAEDRAEIQAEIDQLAEEVSRIAENTEFNTQNLLDGTLDDNVFQIGANEGQNIELAIDDMGADALGVAVESEISEMELDDTDLSAEASYDASRIESVTVGGEGEGDAIEADFALFNSDGNVVAVSADGQDFTEIDATAIEDLDEDIDTDGNALDFSDQLDEGQTMSTGTVEVSEVYEDADGEDVVDITYSSGIHVDTQAEADAAITTIDAAIEEVSSQRSELGAVQNRLDHTIANLEVASENLQAAESRIRDVDMADEMTEFSKQQILEQAGTAMLAQANQAPQSVLQLLG